MKLAKMSLAAVLAAGTLTSLSAGGHHTAKSTLEQAVANTELSGSVRLRYDEKTGKRSNNEYRFILNTKTKINDSLKLNTQLFSEDHTDNGSQDVSHSTTSTNDDGVEIKRAYVTYTGVENLTLNVGKQAIVTAFTDGRVDDVGSGVLATYNLDNVSVTLGRFLNTNHSGVAGNDFTIAKIGTSVEGVNIDAQYGIENVDTNDYENKLLAVLVDTEVALDENTNLSIDAAYAEKKVDVATGSPSADAQQYRVIAGLDFGEFNFGLGYTANGKEDGDVTLTSDKSSPANFYVRQLRMYKASEDAKGIYATVGAKVTSKLSADVEYFNVSDYEISSNVGYDASEIKTTLAYKVSKNFKVKAWYSLFDEDLNNEETKEGRIEAKYKF